MYSKLFTPVKVGNLEIKNRTVSTAMVMNFNTYDGKITDQFIKYLEEKAKGGYGLIITEDYSVNEHAKGFSRIAGLYNDEQMEGNRKLTDTIHKYGTKIFCQLYHPGRQTNHNVNGGVQPTAVSPIACPMCREMPRELTVEEIHQIVREFGAAAGRAKAAGFDGVEIHSGNGYLIAGFLSPYQNRRTDEYGGCFENRVRLLTEVVLEIKKNVGDDFPLSVRFSTDEDIVGGRTLAESRMIAILLEKLGVSMLNCSNGTYCTHNLAQSGTQYQSFGVTMDKAYEIKKVVHIPVLAVNRIKDPLMADQYLDLGWFDLVGLSRASLADPHFPEKASKGDFAGIRPCLGCKTCENEIFLDHQCHCAVNPYLGQEWKYNFAEKPAKIKNVMVIGGGPAGLTAAIAASKRGHQVDLYEKGDKLGGTFIAASYPPGKNDLAHYVAWMNQEVKKYPITVHYNTEVTADMVKELNPDKVILAVGGHPSVPPISGIAGKNVVKAEDVLLGKVQVEGNLVVAGGGEVGIETAAYLAMGERGSITVVEMLPVIGNGMNGILKSNAMRILRDRQVTLMPGTAIKEFTDHSVIISQDGKDRELPADAIVLAMGYKPNTELKEALSFLGDQLSVVGDCGDKCSNIMNANLEGLEAGYNA